MDAVDAARWLRDESARLDPGPPVATTYHPLSYAWESHAAYLRWYADGPRRVLLVGMNPGPWGMGQTGIPFGDVEVCRDWLGLGQTQIDAPPNERPKRPVMGWACHRREPSGRRIWGYLQERFQTPDKALAELAIANHCPLLMFNEDGQNLTPDKLRKVDRETVYAVCDAGLARTVEALRPEILIGVGKYAESRCKVLADQLSRPLQVLSILHPSPASPLANRDGGRYWRDNVDETFRRAGLLPSP